MVSLVLCKQNQIQYLSDSLKAFYYLKCVFWRQGTAIIYCILKIKSGLPTLMLLEGEIMLLNKFHTKIDTCTYVNVGQKTRQSYAHSHL